VIFISVPLSWIWRAYVLKTLLTDEGDETTEGLWDLAQDWARRQLGAGEEGMTPPSLSAPPTVHQIPDFPSEGRGECGIVGTPEWIEEQEMREQFGYRAPRRPRPCYCGTHHHHNY
jgi:hypothetical protein